MLVGEFADEPKNNPPPKIEFVKVKIDQFDRLTTDDPKLSTLIEGHESQHYDSPGANGPPMVPSAYLDILRGSSFRFAETEAKSKAKNAVNQAAAKAQIDAMTAVVKDERLCRVIQWVEGDKKVGRNFCVVMGTEPMIFSFAGNIIEIWKKVAEVIPVTALPTPEDGSQYTIEFFQPGNAASQIKTVFLNADDITDQAGSTLLEYADVDLCWACYNLVTPIT